MSKAKDMATALEEDDPLAAALAYAAFGLPVFPCWPKAKNPMTAHGFKDATTDPDQIKAWWFRRPDANIGLAIPAEMVVIDVDAATCRYDLPPTAMARTGRGFHHWYRTTGRQFRNRVGLAPNVDVKAAGGYVIVPPSVHENGARYEWLASLYEITEAPAWLLVALGQPS
jgi:hypothetical protein